MSTEDYIGFPVEDGPRMFPAIGGEIIMGQELCLRIIETLKYVRSQANIPMSPNASASKDIMLQRDCSEIIADLTRRYTLKTGKVI